MEKWAKVAAALLAVALAGCAAGNGASGNGGNGAGANPTATGKTAMYCMDGKLQAVQGGYSCTWAKSHKEACDATERVVVKEDTIASGPIKGGMCSHGDRIVHVVLK